MRGEKRKNRIKELTRELARPTQEVSAIILELYDQDSFMQMVENISQQNNVGLTVAYEILNNIYYNQFGQNRYKDAMSFHQTRNHWIKKKLKN